VAVSVLSSIILSQVQSSKELNVCERSVAGLFTWTLTHFTPAFSEVRPVFRTRKKLEEQSQSLEEKVLRIALNKIESEWSAWVRAHEGFTFDEIHMDNILMRVLYPFILKRDGNCCTLCEAKTQLTIHHIIQKRRNLVSSPPFGRSVPTNLITLCRGCHSYFDPGIL
jgi:hypothetical protein